MTGQSSNPEDWPVAPTEIVTATTLRPLEVDLAVGANAIIESENTRHRMLGFRAEGYAKACAEAWGLKWK